MYISIKQWCGVLGSVFFIIIIAGIPLVPVRAADAPTTKPYQAIVKINTYILDTYDNLTLFGSGSGIIIDPTGLVLTNYHVTSYEEDFDNSLRETSFQICLTADPNEEPDCSYTGQMVARDKDLDVALVKMTPIEQLATMRAPFPYLKLDGSNSIATKSKISILGYPAIGSETITITEGIISGKINKYKKDWLKTDAVTSFGNSGGAAISGAGLVVGLTSEAHSDLVGTLGYLINISSLAGWITQHTHDGAQGASFENKIVRLAMKQSEIKKTDTFQNDSPPYSVVKPHDWDFKYEGEGTLAVTKKADDTGGAVMIETIPFPVHASPELMLAKLKRDASANGILGLLTVSKNTPVTINGVEGRKVVLSAAGTTKTVYWFGIDNYGVEVSYGYGRSDKDKAVVDGIINSLRATSSLPFERSTTYENADPVISLISTEAWPAQRLNSLSRKAFLFNEKMPNAFIVLEFAKIDVSEKDFTNDEKLDLLKNRADALNNASAALGVTFSVVDSSPHFKLNDEINDTVKVVTKKAKIGTSEPLLMMADHYFKYDDRYVDISFNMFTASSSEFDAALAEAQPIITSLSLKPLSARAAPPAAEVSAPEPSVTNQPTTAPVVTTETAGTSVQSKNIFETIRTAITEKSLFWSLAVAWGLAIMTTLFFLIRSVL